MSKPVEGNIQVTQYKTYRAMIYIGNKRATKTFKTEESALEWLKQISEQKQNGLTYDANRLKIGQWLDDWYTIHKNTLKINTQDGYERAIRLHLKPALGKIRVQELTPFLLQKKYNELVAGGLTRRPLEVAQTVLRQALEHAVRLGIIQRNSADLITLPKVANPKEHDPDADELNVWEDYQVTQFLISLGNHRNRNLYHLALATGMRRGELIGLQWDCIDFVESTLLVKQQVVQIPKRFGQGGWKFQTPKTKAGRRTIAIGPNLLAALRSQRHVISELRTAAQTSKNPRWDDNNLVFPSTVGTPQDGYMLSKEFDKLARLAGLPDIRFHDLRHTAASIMLANNTPITDVSYILGHSSVSVTMDIYAHYLPSRGAEIAALMDRITTPIAIDLAPPQQPANK